MVFTMWEFCAAAIGTGMVTRIVVEGMKDPYLYIMGLIRSIARF